MLKILYFGFKPRSYSARCGSGNAFSGLQVSLILVKFAEMLEIVCRVAFLTGKAEKFRRSERWVSKRLKLTNELIKEVKNAIFLSEISIEQALIIGQVSKNKQSPFLHILLQKQAALQQETKDQERRLTAKETRLELKLFLNFEKTM